MPPPAAIRGTRASRTAGLPLLAKIARQLLEKVAEASAAGRLLSLSGHG